MEYFLGSLITLLIMSYFSKRTEKAMSKKIKTVKFSQSHIDRLIERRLVDEILSTIKVPIRTQASVYNEKNNIPVLIIEQQAFWIVDQTLYVADMVDGVVDNDSTRKVDTMTMSDVQLEKTEFIVKKLTEGKGNDSGYPRKP
jgi:hypothetical protein